LGAGFLLVVGVVGGVDDWALSAWNWLRLSAEIVVYGPLLDIGHLFLLNENQIITFH
jgi:hypothetical protein